MKFFSNKLHKRKKDRIQPTCIIIILLVYISILKNFHIFKERGPKRDILKCKNLFAENCLIHQDNQSKKFTFQNANTSKCQSTAT